VAIRTGDSAQGFELPHKPGETIDVGTHIGSEPVVLLFFPLAFSPTCTDEFCTMRDEWDSWASLDAKVFGVTCDSPFVTDRFREELRIPFPILSDFNRDVAKSWGAIHDELLGLRDVPKRAAFVVDANGSVAYDWVSDDPSKLPDFAAVKSAVESVKVGS